MEDTFAYEGFYTLAKKSILYIAIVFIFVLYSEWNLDLVPYFYFFNT